MLTKVAADPHPDRLQVLQRMKVRLICSDADLIVPVDKPCVQAEGVDEFVGVDLEEPLPSVFQPLPHMDLDEPPEAVEQEEVTSSA